MILPILGGAALLLLLSSGGGSSSGKRRFVNALTSEKHIGLGKVAAIRDAVAKADKESQTSQMAMRSILDRLEMRVQGQIPPETLTVGGMNNLELGELVGYLYQLESDPKELRAWASALKKHGTTEAVGLLLNKAHAIKTYS